MKNLNDLTTEELKDLAIRVSAELDKRGEDDPVWLTGYDAGENAGAGCLCGDPLC
jgi:hypothetical protein